MPPVIRFVGSPLDGQIVELREGEPITLGRDATNTVRILDRKLSRIHCQIELRPEGVIITDLNSTNGTFVNGRQITEARLEIGDEVTLGLTKFRLVEGVAPESQEARASAVVAKCEECASSITEEEMATGRVRRVGTRYYCSRCAADFNALMSDRPSRPEPLSSSRESMAVKPESPPVKEFRPGEEFAGNRIIEKIADSTLGPVYKAEQLTMRRTVTLKVLQGIEEKSARELIAQAYAAGCLVHPNIVLIYDAGESNGVFYLIVEWVEGQTLKQILQQQGSLSPAEAFPIVTQIGYALEHAYEQNMSHGGLTPRKVFVTEKGVTKVTDFGLSMYEIETQPDRTFPVFDLPYRPPEQIRDPRIVNFQVDVYSLGAMFYHMLAGQPPFTGDTPDALSHAIQTKPVPPLREIVPNVPPAVQRMIERALAKRPEARYQMPKELLYDFEEVMRREI